MAAPDVHQPQNEVRPRVNAGAQSVRQLRKDPPVPVGVGLPAERKGQSEASGPDGESD